MARASLGKVGATHPAGQIRTNPGFSGQIRKLPDMSGKIRTITGHTATSPISEFEHSKECQATFSPGFLRVLTILSMDRNPIIVHRFAKSRKNGAVCPPTCLDNLAIPLDMVVCRSRFPASKTSVIVFAEFIPTAPRPHAGMPHRRPSTRQHRRRRGGSRCGSASGSACRVRTSFLSRPASRRTRGRNAA